MIACKSASGQCDPNFSDTERTSVTRERFACFVRENARLKADLEQAIANLQNRPMPRIGWVIKHFTESSFTAEKCKTNAVSAVLNRGGAVVEMGSNWIDLKFGQQAVSVDCDTSTGEGLVAVSGPDNGEDQNISQAVANAIFPGKNPENHGVWVKNSDDSVTVPYSIFGDTCTTKIAQSLAAGSEQYTQCPGATAFTLELGTSRSDGTVTFHKYTLEISKHYEIYADTQGTWSVRYGSN